MERRTKLSGVIFSDLEQAASFMALAWVQKALQESLGFSPYPATLNVRIESKKELEVWRNVRRELAGIDIGPPDSSFCQARCFPVEIEARLQGAVLLPGIQGYPADKVEVIAPVRLKDALQLRDGDRITLEFIE